MARRRKNEAMRPSMLPPFAGINLFKHLASRTKWPGGTKGLYFDYLETSCHFEFAETVAKTRHTETFNQLMKCPKCLRFESKKKRRGKVAKEADGRCSCNHRPAYFSFKNSGDLQKLSDLIQMPLVIEDFKKRTIFDNSVFYLLGQYDEAQKHLGIRLTKIGNCRSIEVTPPSPESLILSLSEELSSTELATGASDPGFLFSKRGTEVLEHLTATQLGGRCLALACRKSFLGPPEDHGWSLLGVYGPSSYRQCVANSVGGTDHFGRAASIDWTKAVVIELTKEGARRLPEDISSRIPALSSATERQSGGSSQRSIWRECLDRMQEKEMTGDTTTSSSNPSIMAASPCSNCSLCTRDLEAWSQLCDNPDSPQSLHQEPDTVVDLLKLAGLWNSDTREAIDRCHQISLVAMDIEAYTRSLAPSAPRAKTQIEAGFCQGEGRSPPEVLATDGTTSENRSLFRQSPALLCSTDFMSGGPHFAHLITWRENWPSIQHELELSSGGRDGHIVGEATPTGEGRGQLAYFFVRDPDDWPKVCHRYLQHELDRHVIALKAKVDILRPILDHLMILKSHHMIFRLIHLRHLVRLREDEVPEDDCTQEELYEKQFMKAVYSARHSWTATHLGKLELALEKIINQRRIYAFNGSSYDFLMLCGPLCMSAPELELVQGVHSFKLPDYDWDRLQCSHSGLVAGLPNAPVPSAKRRGRMKVSRNGGKINDMTLVGTGIQFGDAIKMMPPGTNLAKFIELMGLPESKGAFPFAKLSDFDYLMETSLPDDPNDWYSILGGGSKPTKESVDQCLVLYRELQCVNLLSYLSYYLAMDCLLLLAGMQKFGWLFGKFVNTKPMVNQKFTAASFSFSAVNNFLKENKRPGFFRANHPLVQAVAQGAMRGGVTAVLGTLGGKASPQPINYHLYRAQTKKTSSCLPGLYAPEPDLLSQDDLCYANRVDSYDVHSLYASSGRIKVIFKLIHYKSIPRYLCIGVKSMLSLFLDESG